MNEERADEGTEPVNAYEKRKFGRHPMDLPVTVFVRDPSGELQRETTILCDASGGGLCFTTRHVERYSPGREIEISVDLQQSGNIRAHMTAQGKVVRTIAADDLRPGEPGVAIILVTPLHFERDI